MVHLFSLILVLLISCGNQEQQPQLSNPQNQEEPTELTVEQKIALTKQCFPVYTTQTERSVGYFEKVQAACLPDSKEQENVRTLIESLRNKLKIFQPEILTPDNYYTYEPKFRSIVNDYQKLQNTLAYCRTQRVLEAQSPVPDDRLFLHAIGDVFGTDSGLEGHQQSVAISYRTKVLQQIKAQLEGQTYIADETQSRPCYEPRFKVLPSGKSPRPDMSQTLLTKLVTQSKNSEDLMAVFARGDLNATRNLLIKQLDALEKGESLFLPAGWTKHAVLYQFTKQPNDQVAFRIFNSGEGIETYHAKSTRGYSTQYFPFVEIIDIAKDRITSFVFLKALQEIATPGIPKSTPQDFYEKLLTALDGKATQVKYDTSMFKDGQQAGTCTYFSTSWLLSSSVSQFSSTDANQEAAAQIEFLVSLKTLKSFAGQKRDWDETQLSLLRKGLVFVSESAARDYQNDFIDYGSLQVAADTGDSVKKTIIEADQKIEQAQAQNAANFKASNLTPTNLPNLSKNLETVTEIRAGSTDRQASSPVFNLNQDLSQLYTELENATLTGYYRKRYDQTHGEAVLNSIEQLALVLSLESNSWRGKDPNTNIEALSKISKLYLFILLKQVDEKQRSPDKISAVSYLTALKLLTVADVINRNFVSVKPQIPSMYQPRAGLILSGKTSIFETSDPRWQEQIKFMREYYAPEKNQAESFFGFEIYPTGIQGEGSTRRFYDDSEAVDVLEDKHWSLKYQDQWPDFKWVKSYIKENHIDTGSWDSVWPNIDKFEYKCRLSNECKPKGFLNAVNRATSEILLNRKASLLLGDNSLPEVFYQLRQLSVISDFFLTGRFSANLWNLDFDTGINAKVGSTTMPMPAARPTNRYSCMCEDHDKSYWTQDREYVKVDKQENVLESTRFNRYDFEYNIFGISFNTRERQPIKVTETSFYASPWVNLKDFNQPFVKYESTQGLIQKCPQDALSKCENKEDKECVELRQNCKPLESYRYTELLQIWSLGRNRALELLDPRISPLRYRIEPNAYILKKTSDPTDSGGTFSRFSLERMRNLMGMNSQSELQLKATLDFFTKYPELYVFPEYQVLFEKLMMEPSLMQDQLSISDHDSELFIKSLKNFCDSKLELFKKFYDYKSIAFTLHMKQLFYQQALFAQVKPLSAQLLAGAPDELFSVIQELEPEQLTEKSFLYRNLAEMFLYSPQLNARDAELLLLAMIEFKATPQQNSDFQDKFAEESVRNILVKQQENLKNIMNNQVLDFVVNHVHPNVPRTSADWVSEGSIYSAQFGAAKFKIDILNGQFYDAGNSRVLFPVEADQFEKVFGDSVAAPSHAVRIGIGTYEWKDAKAQKNGISWTFQKKIDNAWYQYLSEEDLKSLGQAQLVLSDYRYWRSIGTVPTVLKIYSLDNQLAFEAKISGRTIQNFKRLKDGAVLIDAASGSDYRVFGQVENWDKVYIWQDANTQKVIEVELPRFYMTFKANSDYIKCADHEDYKIAQKQYVTELGNPVNYMVCDLISDPKNTQKKLVLMPPSRLGPLIDPKTGTPKATLSTQFETYFKSNHFLAYEVDPVFGLSKNSESSRYYLALRKLFKREYRQAAEEIRSTSIELKALETNAELKSGIALDPNELDILNWLIEGNSIDNDPRSYAVSLLAAYWKSKHEQYYLGVFEPVPGDLYKKYLEKVGRVDTAILGVFEEEQIAKSLGQTARLEQLQKEAQNQPFNPSPVFVNPSATSLSRAENNLSLGELETLFQASFQRPQIGQQPALAPKEIITDNTFPLLYQILSGDLFNQSQALELLELVLGVRPAGLTDAQIREEFLTLIHIASLTGSNKARFLEAVAKTKNLQKELLTLAQTKDRISQFLLAKNQEKEADLEDDKYYASLKRKNPYSGYARRPNSRYYELQRIREGLESSLRSYFDGIKNNDLESHKIVVNDIAYGSNKPIPGSKKQVVPEASADISSADLPLVTVAKEDPLKEPLFSPEQLAEALSIQELDTAQKNKIATEAESLQDSLNRSQNKAVQRLKTQIGVQALEVQKIKRFYQKINWDLFKAPNITPKETELKNLKDDILVLGQRYASAFEGGALNRVLHLADVGKQLNIDDLIYALMHRKMVSLYNTQGALKLDELNKLYENLVRYLMLSTYLDHVGRFQVSIKTARDACSNTNTDDCQIKLGNAVSLAQGTRNYAIGSHIEYLVFEYFMKILIRPEQVVALDKLQIKEGRIHDQKPLGGLLELIMGAGKTSVLLPLLSVLDNSGQWLNMIVLPEALIASMSVELSQQLGSSFSRGVFVMDVSRQRYLHQKDLNLLYDRLVQAKTQNKTVVTTNSAIQSLFLSFVDRLSRYKDEPNQVSAEIEQFQKIFMFLRQYGRLTIDEVDLALDILQAHQFSVGSPKSLVNNPILKTVPVVAFSLYREIATNKALYEALDFPFLANRGREAFTAGAYQKFRSSLVDAILKPQFLNVREDLNKIYNQNIESLKDLAKTYLLSHHLSDRNALFAKITDPRLKDIFSVIYDEVNHVLPLTAVRKIGVHYGPLVTPIRKATETQNAFDRRMLTYKNSRLIAIPYHSGEPMVNSRFGTPLEALNYTLQLALYQKGYRESIEQEIKALKKMRSNPNFSEKLFYKRLEDLTGPGVTLNIMQVTPHRIDLLHKRLQESQQIAEQLELDWLYVVPQVRFNELQLTTNAQIYESLFGFIQGFTGTLWSSETFPKVFQNPIQSDTAEKTFLIVWQDYLEHKKPLLVLTETSPYLTQIYSGQFKGSLMDEAGIFRGQSNFDIAHKIKADTGNKVAFYDDLNKLVSCCENGFQVPLKNKVPENHLVAFWDKKHTTGSDIKLMPDMTAAMTVDFHITSRSFQQTAWRLRGLGNGQKVVTYAALFEDMNIMRERLKNEWHLEPESSFALGDLILYSVLNEDTKLDELKFRALKQKMKNIVVSQVLNNIFSETKSAQAMYSSYDLARGLFEKNSGGNLYLKMGIPVETQSIQIAIEAEKHKLFEASYLTGLDRGSIKSQVNHLIQNEEPVLPKTVQYSDQEDGNEVEIETETELEDQQEREEQTDDFSAFRDFIPHKVLPWNFRNFEPIRLVDLEYLNQVHGSPIVNLKQALSTDKLKALSHAISDDFLVSLNFAPLHHQHKLMKADQTPYEFEFFGPYHKNLQDILLVQNKVSGKFKCILIDDNDAKDWDEFLRTHPHETTDEDRIALYNLSTHQIYRETSDLISEADIPLELLVEASFLAGRVNYPGDQLSTLKTFLERSGPRAMLQVFRTEILHYKLDTLKAFRGSDLERIFIDILGSVD